MVLNIGIGLGLLVIGFLIYIAKRPKRFRYERSGLIQAPPEVIFPYLSRLSLGAKWSPFEQAPDIKRTFGGVDGQAGSFEEFESSKSGSGRITVNSVKLNQEVDLRLEMFKPFVADNHVVYRLNPEPNGTRFVWVMEGENVFIGKLVGALIDCEKMVAGQFEVGISNLKTLIEGGERR